MTATNGQPVIVYITGFETAKFRMELGLVT